MLNEHIPCDPQLCDGSVKEIRTGRMTWVDVRDVALAHVVAAEKSNADGRFAHLR